MAWVLVLGVVLGVLLVIGLFVLVQFNRMVGLRNRIQESWGNIEAELQRRHDLVPNLVRAVQAIAAHEQTTFAAVNKARSEALRDKSLAAEDRLVRSVNRLLAVAEAYPKLQSSKNFLGLQEELAITEDRIAAARRYHNGNVRTYLNQIRQMPGNLVARTFGFGEIAYYEVPEVEVRAVPKVA